MNGYSLACDYCEKGTICMCCDIEPKEGEKTLYISLSQYKNMYFNTIKNKTNTSKIIFQNFENTNKDKKRTVYRDDDNNCLYFKNFENKKRVYLVPEILKPQEKLHKKEPSMAKLQMDMFEEQLENFHNLNI